MSGGWVYILTNKAEGTLYIGVTSDLPRRIWEHREGAVAGFTRRYNLKRLVHVERYEVIEEAIRREKVLKTWRRAWKLALVAAGNPEWRDLYDDLAGGM
ncbi:MAG: GIY-YIG nuclease family protein [Ferrovibrio sp.]|uniref:GIY-YIG nuclease family protein n=1 Tax=Ferrovibrio sp. TaxID=1917215 RepID=UPI002634E83A|nr:GIY-YIG nuclease family protein [Ferrovibrio sp.]MCW0232336.1 GIY-YIG nuclease family protein [Ferrovibrio sp.]